MDTYMDTVAREKGIKCFYARNRAQVQGGPAHLFPPPSVAALGASKPVVSNHVSVHKIFGLKDIRFSHAETEIWFRITFFRIN